jgi:hypothetical protein
MRVEDEVITFRFGAAVTTNADLANFIMENMKVHFEVSLEDIVNPKDLIIDAEESVIEEVEEVAVVVDDVKPKRKKRRRIR